MQKTRRTMLLVALLLVIVAALLCSCGDNKSKVDPGDNKKQEEVDSEGWMKIEKVDNKELINKFLIGFTSVAYDLSYDSVLNKEYSATGKVNLEINDSDFFLTIKGKYDDKKKREKAILSVELSSEEKVSDKNRILSFFIFQDKLYLAIENSKVCFNISNFAWDEYYPYRMENYKTKSSSLTTISGFLSNSIKFKTTPIGYSRTNSSKQEYKYSVDIDFNKTMQSISNSLSELAGSDSKTIVQVQNFFANILGLSLQDVQSGNFPAGVVKLDFFISGDNIQTLDLNLEVNLSEKGKKLYGDDKLKIGAKIKEVRIEKSYSAIPIDLVNEGTSDYVQYNKAIYSVNLPIDVYEAKNDNDSEKYNLHVITRVFQDDNTKNFVFFEYAREDKGIIDRALYVYDNVLYVVLYEDGKYVCKYQMPIDLSDVATRVAMNDLKGESEVDPYAIVVYVLRSLAMNDDGIGFAIDRDFFSKIWYNFDDLIDYMNEISPQGDFKSNEDVNEFINFMRDNQVIVNLPFKSDTAVNVILEDDELVENIIERIQGFKTEEEETEPEITPEDEQENE